MAADRLTDAHVARLAYQAGFRGRARVIAVAVALAESGGDAHARGDVGLQNGTWGPSIGLWQIRSVNAQAGTGGQRDAKANLTPATNARHAYQISGHGSNWQPWSTYTQGTYRQYLDRARKAVLSTRPGTASHPTTHRDSAASRPATATRIVLDLAELRRFETLIDTSAHRVRHSAAVLDDVGKRLAGRATEPGLVQYLGLLAGPTGLPMVARHLDFDTRLVQRIRTLAAAADGPDGRYRPADLIPFLRKLNGHPIGLAETAVIEALALGRVATAAPRRHAAPTVPQPPPRQSMKSGDIVPAALDRYRNGRLPTGQLVPIGAGEQLYRPVAAAFTRMASAARAAGVTLTPVSGYRDVAEQSQLYQLYLAGKGNLAAAPGHSNHGWGLAVDVDVRSGAKTLSWLRANAARYGFFPDVAGEPWHWTYRPA